MNLANHYRKVALYLSALDATDVQLTSLCYRVSWGAEEQQSVDALSTGL